LVATIALVPALKRRLEVISRTQSKEVSRKAVRGLKHVDDDVDDVDPARRGIPVRIVIDDTVRGLAVDFKTSDETEAEPWPRRDSFTSFQGGIGISETGTPSDSERSADFSDSGLSDDRRREGRRRSSKSTAEDANAAANSREFGCHYGLREWAVARMSPSNDVTTESLVATESSAVRDIHANAEMFDANAEMLLTYLQVFTACVYSFAHGANDVANACGPFAAIWGIYKTGRADHDIDVPLWVLLIGGVGLVVGLASLGVKIIKQIGLRLSKITPSRGMCIELGAAIVVLVGTRFGIPLSTTHCQVGATTGVAMLEGSGGVNWRLLARVVFGWVITIVVAALAAAAFTAQGLYAPHIYRREIDEM
jgi:sodium-dependent phosphate transporter